MKGQINTLEQAFRIIPTAAVKRELNRLRRNGVAGKTLLGGLTDIFHQHRLSERVQREKNRVEKDEIPGIIRSEVLL